MTVSGWVLPALLLVGASGLALDAASAPGPSPTPGPQAVEAGADTEYRIGVGDVLRVEVYGEPALSGDFTVQADGKVVYPLVGDVELGGIGAPAATERLTRLLERDYLYEPKVSVTVKEYRSQKVEILGRVTRPGTFFLDRPTRLLDLLARAGGLSGATDIRRGQLVRVVRQASQPPTSAVPSPSTTLLVDLYELLIAGAEGANLPLEGGDVVYVPETLEVHVVGEVKKPGSLPYEEGLTVLKAISLAGGTTPRAAARKVVIRRIQNGQEVQVKARMEDQLQPDDVVEVPLGFW